MKKCSFCGENTTKWGLNFSCRPTDTPAFEDHLPSQPELSAVARGFSPGDIVRNKHGHIGIVTYANHKWGDIRVRLRCTSEFPTTAMGWRVIKKASAEQAKRWLAEVAVRAKNEFPFHRDFRVDPITNETIFLHEDKTFRRSTEINFIHKICKEDFWNNMNSSFKKIDLDALKDINFKIIKINKEM